MCKGHEVVKRSSTSGRAVCLVCRDRIENQSFAERAVEVHMASVWNFICVKSGVNHLQSCLSEEVIQSTFYIEFLK